MNTPINHNQPLLCYSEPVKPKIRQQATHEIGSPPAVGLYNPKLGSMFASHRLVRLFSSTPWIETLAATYGFEVRASTLEKGNIAEAAILYCEIDDIRGRRIVSLPFSDYCDPIVEDQANWERLVAPVLSAGLPVRFRCVFNEVAAKDARFTKSVSALWHGANLQGPEEEIWRGLKDGVRQNVRRAKRHGIVVREGRSSEDLHTFYRMHSHVRKTKYGLFAQPFSFFENLRTAFMPQNRIVVMLAELDGVAIAGTLYLIWGDTLYYKFNASIETAFRPNDLLIWSGMTLGRRLGLSHLDFGSSSLDQPGLIEFKRKFASEERPLMQLEWTPQGFEDRRGQATCDVLHQLTRILTRTEVPDNVARSTGDLVYRFFC